MSIIQTGREGPGDLATAAASPDSSHYLTAVDVHSSAQHYPNASPVIASLKRAGVDINGNTEIDPAELEVIAANFKRRLSGVTTTVIQLVAAQRSAGLNIAAFGLGLPQTVPQLPYRAVWKLWTPPRRRRYRIFHARRNTEMIGGLILRDVLRMPMKVVFTSASQRRHKRFTKFLIRRMDAIISVSERTAAYLERPSTVIWHGIDTARFRPPVDRAAAKRAVGLDPSTKVIGCVGRIRHQKGTDLFVESLIDLFAADLEWTGVIAGRATPQHASFEADLRRRIEQAGLRDRILFVGEHADIERWYQALDLYVAPQRWEGFGLTPLEAMACGVPVIATDVGVFSSLIVEGETGHVLKDLKPATMKAAIALLTHDDPLRERMGKNARRHVETNFSLDREIRQLNELYDSVAPLAATAGR